jgi:hypothetical protein
VILRPQAIRMVLAHGLPVVFEVTGESMTPPIERGSKLRVEPVFGDLQVGDIVVIALGEGQRDDLTLHRVMHLFSDGGQRFVIHQGDAPASAFAACARERVIGRATGFVPPRLQRLPTLANLPPEARARFARRRRACALFSLGRRMMSSLRLGDRKLTRRLGRAFRMLARTMAR